MCFAYRANWVRVNGTKYQMPFAVVIGKDEELTFGNVTSIYVDGKSVLFEFFPMITHQFYHHYHAFALAAPAVRCRYLIKHTDLPDFHPYGLYHSTSVSNDSTLQYVVLKSNVYVHAS